MQPVGGAVHASHYGVALLQQPQALLALEQPQLAGAHGQLVLLRSLLDILIGSAVQQLLPRSLQKRQQAPPPPPVHQVQRRQHRRERGTAGLRMFGGEQATPTCGSKRPRRLIPGVSSICCSARPMW